MSVHTSEVHFPRTQLLGNSGEKRGKYEQIEEHSAQPRMNENLLSAGMVKGQRDQLLVSFSKL